MAANAGCDVGLRLPKVPPWLSRRITSDSHRLPAIANDAGAGGGRGMFGELAVEPGGDRPVGGEAHLDTRRGQRGIPGRRSAGDEETLPRQRLEARGQRGIADPVMRLGQPPGECHDLVRRRWNDLAVEASAKLGSGVGDVARSASETKA